MEDLARATRIDTSSAVEAEQRVIGAPAAALDLACEKVADERAVWNEAALSKFAATHNEQLTIDVDVADQKAARLTGSQPEAVAEGEDGVIGGAAVSCSRVVRKRRGGLEQPSRLHGVEKERQALIGLSAVHSPHR